eukprot:TRINITY_DN6218_c0_g1_i3.p1 TRINITY_DN6218_c0_g1~~TRINITY_DN6218_c0_g1_i3.p1  ORF type:complete len:828 (-),score=178.79 TRINITY_DN6218_c0_g1_i3:503-2965(-)
MAVSAAKAAAKRSFESFSLAAAAVKERPSEARQRFSRDGLLHVKGAIPEDAVDTLRSFVKEELSRRRRENDPRRFGAVYGYEDSGKRWDLKLALTSEVAAALGSLLPVIEGVLLAADGTNEGDATHGAADADGETREVPAQAPSAWMLAELAAMCTSPGDPGQPTHADTSYLYDHHVVTVFCALHDIHATQGPTRMHPGTHTDRELHMGLKTIDENGGVLCTMSSGDCVLMDSRLLHCGTANTSLSDRSLFYCSWTPTTTKQRSCGSTNTLLEAYEGRLCLSSWRDWVAQPPPAELLAGEASLSAAVQDVDGPGKAKRRRRMEPGAFSVDGTSEPMCPRRQALVAWLRNGHGVDLRSFGLEIRRTEDRGFGVFALRPVSPGTTLAKIPESAVLHAGKVHDSDFGRKALTAVNASGEKVAPEELLWLYMAWGRKDTTCPWHAYLQSLPTDVPHAWCTDTCALQRLRCTPLYHFAVDDIQQQRHRHASLTKALSAHDSDFQLSRVSFEDWLWAWSCYSSRAFQQRMFPTEYFKQGWESDVLCPFLDLFNHSHDAGIETRFGDESATLLLPLSADGFDGGDEVCIPYGSAVGNEELLRRFGFALKDNPRDGLHEVALRLPAPLRADPALRAARLQSLRECADLEAQVERCTRDAVVVRLQAPLSVDLLETPAELLRVAMLLTQGCDYHEETASCADKRDAARAAARALLRMRQRISGTAPSARRGEGARCAGSDADAPKRQRFRPVALRSPELPPPETAAEMAADAYAGGVRRILRHVASRASEEAEMAELAANFGGASPEDAENSGAEAAGAEASDAEIPGS